MPLVRFTQNLAVHCTVRDVQVGGTTVREALDNVFSGLPQVRSYVLNDQDGLRKHMAVFVDAIQIHDRSRLSDPVRPDSTIDIIQALSGG